MDLKLVKAIKNLSGEKIVYTNGSKFHANRVLKARGLTECFHKIYGVEDADYLPKPEEKAYQKIIELSGIKPQYSVMFEDAYKNLDVPHDLGMRTVYLTEKNYTDERHFVTDNLTEFLSKLTNNKNGN